MSSPLDPPAGDKPLRQPWLLTFADLVSLMLTFFVLLFSMSQVEQEAWDNIVRSLEESIHSRRESAVFIPQTRLNILTERQQSSISLDYLTALLRQQLRQVPAGRDLGINLVGDRLILSLPTAGAFQAGSAELSPAATETLRLLGGLLRNIGNAIEVIGHTEPNPYTGRFGNAWSLATARAVATANELRRMGYKQDIPAFGIGGGHFQGLSPRLSESERLALARRVDIIVLSRRGGGRE